MFWYHDTDMGLLFPCISNLVQRGHACGHNDVVKHGWTQKLLISMNFYSKILAEIIFFC